MPKGIGPSKRLVLLDALVAGTSGTVTGSVVGYPGGPGAVHIYGTLPSATVTIYGALDEGTSASTFSAITNLSSLDAEVIPFTALPEMFMNAVVDNSSGSASATAYAVIVPL